MSKKEKLRLILERNKIYDEFPAGWKFCTGIIYSVVPAGYYWINNGLDPHNPDYQHALWRYC